MIQNKVIIAAAGSGKTQKIVQDALSIEGKNILITTYTIANSQIIKQRLANNHSAKIIPTNIRVKSWFSFLLQDGIKPYCNKMFPEVKKIRGVNYVQGTSTIQYGDRKYRQAKKTSKEYYFTSKNFIHSDKLSAFAYECNQKSDNMIVKRLAKIYDYIFIDEGQDLAGYDAELICSILDVGIKVIIVCDPRQQTYVTHHTSKNKNQETGYIIIDKYLENKSREDVIIDIHSLTTNCRSHPEICSFSNKIYPDLMSANLYAKNIGRSAREGIFIVKENDKDRYMFIQNIVRLRWSKSSEHSKFQ